MTEKLTSPVSLNLPGDQVARLDRAAAEFMQTRSSLARMIFEGWLRNFEHPSAREALRTINTEEPQSQ